MVVVLIAAGCGRHAAEPAAPWQAPTLRHDYGSIPHGETRTHTFAVQLPPGRKGIVPLGFRGDCTCTVHEFRIRDRSGATRSVGTAGDAASVVQDGETLLLLLTLDTGMREAANLQKTTSQGMIICGEREDPDANRDPVRPPLRHLLPVSFTYEIRARVTVLPVAHVNFGRLPRSREFKMSLELRGSDPARPPRFGAVRTNDRQVEARLAPGAGCTLLHVHVRPTPGDAAQAARYEVEIETDLTPPYLLRIPVSGEFVPDVQIEPMDRISFERFDFTKPAEQFVTVIDHDLRREAGFVVQRILDDQGRPADQHFQARIEAVSGEPRASRLVLRYVGGLEGRFFRGTITLTKPDGKGPAATVEYVGFNARS